MFSGQGAVLGLIPDWPYRDSLVNLDAGDKLLFTDAMVEAENLELEEFGDTRLMLEAAMGDQALDTQQRVMRQVSAFCNSNFPDDATLGVVAMA